MKKFRWLFVGVLFAVLLVLIATMVRLEANSQKAISNKEETVTITMVSPAVSNDKDQSLTTSDPVSNTSVAIAPSGLVTIDPEDIGPFYPNLLYHGWTVAPLNNH